MQPLVVCFLSALIVVAPSVSVMKTDVRMLVSPKPRGPFKPCDLVKGRAPKFGSKSFLHGCDLKYLTFHKTSPVELQFNVEFHKHQLEAEYQHLPRVYRMWYINRLLNKGRSQCSIATGRGRTRMPTDSTKGLQEFILVGPNNASLCKQLKESKFEKTGMEVERCEIDERREERVDGYLLAKYSVQIDVDEKLTNPVLFLSKLNKDQGCLFNGYWAVRERHHAGRDTHDDDDGEHDDDTHDHDDDDHDHDDDDHEHDDADHDHDDDDDDHHHDDRDDRRDDHRDGDNDNKRDGDNDNKRDGHDDDDGDDNDDHRKHRALHRD